MFRRRIAIIVALTSMIALGAFYYRHQQTQAGDWPIKAVQGDSEHVRDIEFSPDGKWIFSAGEDGLKQWDAKTLKLVKHFDIPFDSGQRRIYSIAVSHDRPIVYLGEGSQDVKVWDYETEQLLDAIPTRDRWAEWVTTLAINQDGTLLAIAENGGKEKRSVNAKPDETEFSILLWDIANAEEYGRLYGHPQAIKKLIFSLDNTKLLSSSSHGSVIWDVATKGLVNRNGDTAASSYSSSGVTPKNNLAFYQRMGSEEDLESTSHGAETNLHGKYIRSFATRKFVSSGAVLIGGTKGSLFLYEIPSGNLQKEFVQFSNGMPIDCVAVSPDGTMAVSGGDGRKSRGMFRFPNDERDRNLCFWQLP